VFSTVGRGLTNLIYDRCSCTLFTLSSVSSSAVYFTLRRSPVEANSVVVGSMCPLKREQARHERESELRLVSSL